VVTLLAITDEVNGVTTENLEYAVHDTTFRRGSSLGVSNVMLGETAQVSVSKGLLLLVHVSQLDGDDPIDEDHQ